MYECLYAIYMYIYIYIYIYILYSYIYICIFMCSCCNKICLYNKTIYNKFIIFIILKKVSNGFERFLAVSITFCLNEKQYRNPI